MCKHVFHLAKFETDTIGDWSEPHIYVSWWVCEICGDVKILNGEKCNEN